MEHFRNIRQKNDIHIVGRHYNSRDHEGLSDLNVYVLDFIHAHRDIDIAAEVRNVRERLWIYRLWSQTRIGHNHFD